MNHKAKNIIYTHKPSESSQDGEIVIVHRLILGVSTSSGLKKGARGEGRGARVSLGYAVRHITMSATFASICAVGA